MKTSMIHNSALRAPQEAAKKLSRGTKKPQKAPERLTSGPKEPQDEPQIAIVTYQSTCPSMIPVPDKSAQE